MRQRSATGTLLLLLTSPVLATIEPPCSGTGTSTSGGEIDLTTATEWHLLSTDIAGGHGESTVEMKAGSVAAHALGLSLPIASDSGDGDTAGSVQGVSVAPFAVLGQRFLVSGSASGDSGSCSGEITIILDDVNPLTTVLGGGGVLVGVVGAAAIVLGARSGGGLGSRLLATVFGALGGAGLGLAGEQFGILDPATLGRGGDSRGGRPARAHPDRPARRVARTGRRHVLTRALTHAGPGVRRGSLDRADPSSGHAPRRAA